MAKLRQNHKRSGKRPFSGLLIRVLIIFAILTVLFVYAFKLLEGDGYESTIPINTDFDEVKSDLVPEGNRAFVINHGHFQLGYNEEYEQADWVVYRLTREQLRVPNVPRASRFEEDPEIPSGSARHHDYSNSGYTRGHLAPAGDLAHSEEAMNTSFYMSNISPQIAGFNGGIWRELEECTRDWAYKSGVLYIAVGPIYGNVTKYIGKSSKIRVPSGFYKIIVDLNQSAGIGFIIDHGVSERHLSEYAISIDRLEKEVQLDFFDDLYDNEELENKIEGTFNLDLWPISDKRYQTRIKNWNYN